MRIDIYVSSDKETGYLKGKEAGFTGQALENCMYLAYEHKMTYEVDENGNGVLIEVDGRKLERKLES
jgi:hypothetical protein